MKKLFYWLFSINPLRREINKMIDNYYYCLEDELSAYAKWVATKDIQHYVVYKFMCELRESIKKEIHVLKHSKYL